MIPTGPPDEPCVEKWLMTGISMPSMKKRFSDGAPPLINMSFRKLGVLATPGSDCMAREMSRFPPGFRLISFTPMLRNDRGLSSLFRNASAFISTVFSSSALFSKGMSMMVGRALLSCTSKIVAFLYPTKETIMLYKEAGRLENV